FDESEIAIVFIEIILLGFRRKSSHDDEPAVMRCDASSTVHDLWDGMTCELFQRFIIKHKHPGVRFTRWPVELAQVHGDIEFAVVPAQIALMVGSSNLL